MPPFLRRSIYTVAGVLLFVVAFAPLGRPAANGSSIDTSPAPMPFEPAEQLVYEGEFSKLLLRGIKIAELKFTAGRAPSAGDNASLPSAKSHPPAPLFFTSNIESKGWFRKLFGINFHYRVESTVEPDSLTILRSNKLDVQGSRVRESAAVFDRARNQVEWTERDPNDATRPPRVVTSPLGGAAHDIISAIYFLRAQTLTPGKTFDLAVSDSGVVYHVPAKVFAEPEKMKSILGRVAVVRVDVEMFGKERLVDGDGKMSLWLTDDNRHIPIRARLQHNLGNLDITLKTVQRG
ncbi:MAG TPA: DUF3108 domain-containing protein [Pyrinomonadaceae bacterium]|nr:DUF3108 domain-containing protein [Pyrinomonadaceae bacterium]